MEQSLKHPEQGGQSLITILMLGVVLALLGYTMVGILRMEMRLTAKTRVTDANFSGGDSALQRTMDKLLEKDSTGAYISWGSITFTAGSTLASLSLITGFSSLTYTVHPTNSSIQTGYNDIPGMQYYIHILAGDRYPSALSYSAKDDTELKLWANQGDWDLDRTIVVRTINMESDFPGVTYTAHIEDRFFTVVHRNPAPPYQAGQRGTDTSGCQALAGWEGNVYNSCSDANGPPGARPCSEGTAQAGCFAAGEGDDFCLNQDTSNPQPVPTPFIPAGTFPVPGYPLVTSNVTGDRLLTNTTSTLVRNFQCNNLDISADVLTVLATTGPVALYVTGDFSISGASSISVTVGSWTCCVPKGFTIYMIGGGAVTWNGTPNGVFVLYAPDSDVVMTGTGNKTFKGAIIAKSIDVSGGGTGVFTYDICLAMRPPADAYLKPPLITTSWKQFLRDK